MVPVKEKSVEILNLVGEESEGFDMSLSAEDMGWIIKTLSSLYKDKYGIVVKEW